MSQWFALFLFFFSLSEPWCHPRFKSPLAGVSASLTWNQRKSKACVREQETRVRGKRWRARKEGPGDRKEAWEQTFRGKKKLMGTDRLRRWDRQRWGSSKSDSASLISYSFVLKWQILHDRYWSQLNWKKVQKHTQRSRIFCLVQIWWFGIFCNKKHEPPSYWVLFWYFQIQSQSRRWYFWTKHKILKVTPASASNFFFVTGLKYWPPSVEPCRKSP